MPLAPYLSSDIHTAILLEYSEYKLPREFEISIQGGPSGREPGLGLLEFWLLHCLPNSAWADGSLAEAAG